ncbi:MAG: biotin-dependent carboxyltransferase family protein [Synergistes sp.]|nr:biotin-dependent carboxyltransferase family protein [Synergistes sp.]
MELTIKKSGLLTTVQDLGRWGYQSDGIPVAGAMDIPALRAANAMVGNEDTAAALEISFMGPEIEVSGGGTAVCTGADLGFCVNGASIGNYRVVSLKAGDVISFRGMTGTGCRAVLAFGGGIDVPVVMKSRSTHTRSKMGGFQGRALKSGDKLATGSPSPLAAKLGGFSVPADILPVQSADAPLSVVTGLQKDAFTDEGIKTFFSEEYTVTAENDRMGCRLDGPDIAHKDGADIVSDAIPLGSVQIPGHGKPIIMLADRQTTGGYTKIGVISPLSIQALAQKMQGHKVRFREVSAAFAREELKKIASAIARIKELAEKYAAGSAPRGKARHIRLTVNGKSYDVICEEIMQ